MAQFVTEFKYLDDSLQPRIGSAEKGVGWRVYVPNQGWKGPFDFLTYKGTDSQNWTIGLYVHKASDTNIFPIDGVYHRLRDENKWDNKRPTFQV